MSLSSLYREENQKASYTDIYCNSLTATSINSSAIDHANLQANKPTTPQTIATATATSVITYDTVTGSGEMIDNFNNGAGSLNIYEAGLYNITAYAKFAANATGARTLYIVTTPKVVSDSRVNNGAALAVDMCASVTLPLAVGNSVQMQVAQDSGGNLNVTDAYLTVTRIGNQL